MHLASHWGLREAGDYFCQLGQDVREVDAKDWRRPMTGRVPKVDFRFPLTILY